MNEKDIVSISGNPSQEELAAILAAITSFQFSPATNLEKDQNLINYGNATRLAGEMGWIQRNRLLART